MLLFFFRNHIYAPPVAPPPTLKILQATALYAPVLTSRGSE